MIVYEAPIATTARAPFACDCGHKLQVYGRDRHRRFYELGDASHVEPIMTRVCPSCGRRLPGKNRR